MVQAANLGYPRFGAKRELKRALESYWIPALKSMVEAARKAREILISVPSA